MFRRTTPELESAGGLVRKTKAIFPNLGGVFRSSRAYLDWIFPSGATIKLAHLQTDADVAKHLGGEYAFVGFDELTTFTEDQFWGLFSRLRSMSGVRPYLRATCNPDPDSFVRRLIDWWIGPDGFAIEARSGVLRWFVRDEDGSMIWGASPEEVVARLPDKRKAKARPKSLTFIRAKLEDNPILEEANPEYRGTLEALPRVARRRLLDGNWNERADVGEFYQRSWFEVVDAAPSKIVKRARAWDRAATKKRKGNDPAATVGVLGSIDSNRTIWIEHRERFFDSPFGVEERIVNIATGDGKRTTIAGWRDPGSAGKYETAGLSKALHGYRVEFETAREDKETYALAPSAQAEAGNIKVVRGPWNDAFFAALEAFPNGKRKDDADALSRLYMALAGSSTLAKIKALARGLSR